MAKSQPISNTPEPPEPPKVHVRVSNSKDWRDMKHRTIIGVTIDQVIKALEAKFGPNKESHNDRATRRRRRTR